MHSSSVSKLGQTQRQNNKKTRQQNHNKEIENTTTQPTTVFHPTMNKPTEVLMPAPSIVALIGNIKATLIYIKPNKKFLFFACGTSVTGSVFGRTGELENKVMPEYKMRVESFTFHASKNTDQFGPLPLGFLPEVAKNELRKEGSGTKIYKIFKGMKSQF